MNHIEFGDNRETMKSWAEQGIKVQMCVTSPPYYGLRDYGTAEWEGGDPNCDHTDARSRGDDLTGNSVQNFASRPNMQKVCATCGAVRKDRQLGLEDTPEEFIENMVDVFRHVREVLADDGVIWVNMGDSYYNYRPGKGQRQGKQSIAGQKYSEVEECSKRGNKLEGYKEKDLIGIPWMLAFALRADGWYLRQDIIWHKPNPMPESVRDRCTKNHEYIFLLSKKSHYFYDNEAIKEPSITNDKNVRDRDASRLNNTPGRTRMAGLKTNDYEMKNKRSVWTVTTKPYKGAHFATFPMDLIEPCILAGTSEKGHCPECGARWVREIEKETNFNSGSGQAGRTADEVNDSGKWAGQQYGTNLKLGPTNITKTVAWKPTCECGHEPVPDVVFDPFMGSGTTAAVAVKNGRQYMGCELNEDYKELQDERIKLATEDYQKVIEEKTKNDIFVNLFEVENSVDNK